jgi:hypothetical protein
MAKKNKRDIIKRHLLVESLEEIPTPPPPGFTSPFKTVHEWLFNICDSEQPKKPISEYSILLFESSENSILCLAGYNTYLEQDCESSRIDFKPSHMFFSLPQDEYKNLSLEQIRERVLNELIEFTKTDKFLSSYLSEQSLITTNFAGSIWPYRR